MSIVPVLLLIVAGIVRLKSYFGGLGGASLWKNMPKPMSTRQNCACTCSTHRGLAILFLYTVLCRSSGGCELRYVINSGSVIFLCSCSKSFVFVRWRGWRSGLGLGEELGVSLGVWLSSGPGILSVGLSNWSLDSLPSPCSFECPRWIGCRIGLSCKAVECASWSLSLLLSSWPSPL